MGERSGLRAASLLVSGLAFLAAVWPAAAQSGLDERTRDATRQTAERVAEALRAYVYASYDVQAAQPAIEPGRVVPAEGQPEELGEGAPSVPAELVDRLHAAREELLVTLEQAGLRVPGEDEGLDGLVPELTTYFEVSSDLRFLPLGAPRTGVTLVRINEQREVPARALGPHRVTYRVLGWDDAVIESRAGYKNPAYFGPAARQTGRTILIDHTSCRRIAKERVIARLPRAAELSSKHGRGEKLAPAEVKDLLRYRALVGAVAEGGEAAVGQAIAREEEVRIAAFFAVAGEIAPESITEREALARAAEDAVRLAVVAGEPRYQLASAIALTVAIPDSPAATGARRALVRLAGGADLTALLDLEVHELRKRARAQR
ncbi:MAG: hypothetical protein ACYS22_07520 [Planctomycetota bacterium]